MSQDKRHFWKVAAGVFLCWGLLASMLASYYWYQYAQTLQRFESTTIRVSVIFDYGNGSIHRKQHRDTLSLAGDSLLSVTVRLAKVKCDVYPIGVLVVSIDGLANTKTMAWLWYRWNQQSKSWLLGETGPDKFFPRNGDIVIWYYTSFESWPPQPPEPPSMSSGSVQFSTMNRKTTVFDVTCLFSDPQTAEDRGKTHLSMILESPLRVVRCLLKRCEQIELVHLRG